MKITYQYNIKKIYTTSADIISTSNKSHISLNQITDPYETYDVKNVSYKSFLDESNNLLSESISNQIKQLSDVIAKNIDEFEITLPDSVIESISKKFTDNIKSSFNSYINSLNDIPLDIKDYYNSTMSSQLDSIYIVTKNSIKTDYQNSIRKEFKNSLTPLLNNYSSITNSWVNRLSNILEYNIPHQRALIKDLLINQNIYNDCITNTTLSETINIPKYIYRVDWEKTGTDEYGNVGTASNSTNFTFGELVNKNLIGYDSLSEEDIISWISADNGNTVDELIIQEILQKRTDVEEDDQFPWNNL